MAPNEPTDRDMERDVECDQSRPFELVYGQEFGMPGGEPCGPPIGDRAVGHHAEGPGRPSDHAGVSSGAALL